MVTSKSIPITLLGLLFYSQRENFWVMFLDFSGAENINLLRRLMQGRLFYWKGGELIG